MFTGCWPAGAEEAAEGQDGRRRFHDAGSQRGHEEHRPQRHGRRLEGIPHAADAGEGLIGTDEPPSDEELRKFDKTRKDKKVSNDEWASPTDPDARITKMKDGTTHLAYKAEHVVDLETEVILAAEIYHADQHDTHTLEDSVHQAQINLQEAGSEQSRSRRWRPTRAIMSNGTLTELREHTPYRTYIPEPELKHNRVWTDKPPEQKAAVYANRRRTRGERGKKLQRLRSERGRADLRPRLRDGRRPANLAHGIEKVRKRYLISAAAHNLGRPHAPLFKMGTPRGLQQFKTDLEGLVSSLYLAWLAADRLWNRLRALSRLPSGPRNSRAEKFSLAIVT